MKVKSFEDHAVWQEAHKLTLEVFKLTVDFLGLKSTGPFLSCGFPVLRFRRTWPRDLAGQLQGIAPRPADRRGELEERRDFVLLSRDLGNTTPKVATTLVSVVTASDAESTCSAVR
jgi:hypothetical protein